MKAVQDGKISEADVDARLDEMLELVLSTHAAVEKAPRTFDAAAHHKLARRAAAESIVLLRNEGGILPLKPNEKLAVIGDFAETPRYQGAGSSAVNALQVDTLLDSIKADDSGITFVGYASGFERRVQRTPRSWKRLWPSQRRPTPFCSASASMSCGRAKALTALT